VSTGETSLVIGLMVGTSLDGIDAGLVEFDASGRPRLQEFLTIDFNEVSAGRLREIASNEPTTAAELSELGFALARDHARAVRAVDPTGLAQLIGAHGVTLAHAPGGSGAHGWQLLNGAALAAIIDCSVACDFRSADIALGGQGAPSPVVGTKRIRLAPGATQGDIAFIEGHVKLVYPTRTETVRLSADSEGARAEREGARLEISGASGGQVGWKLEGRSDRMLHLRALNAAEQPLMQQSSMQMGSAFGMGSGVSGSTEFAGKVAHVEAVFAVEEEAWEFPFSLTHMRPGTSREQTVVDTQELSKFSIDRIRRELAAATRDLKGQVASHSESETRAGPFVVALESVWSFRGLMPRFQVRAPEIAPLEQSLSALELSLREIRLKDGTIYEPQPGDTSRWSQMLVLAETWGGEGLRADASLETRAEADGDQVAAISGALVLRLPREVSTLQMPEVVLGAEVEAEGFSAVVSELARDRFVLRSREGGDRVLAVRAYNADGDSLWMTGAKTARTEAGWQGEFGVQGVPARVELVVAKDLETAEYPFSMTLAAN
jgi:hypothetical protein